MPARRLTTTLLTSTMLAALPLLALPAMAQTAAPPEDDSIEVIVTAQKRAQRLQDVPVSIQVLGTKKLDQLNISNFNDYAAQLPSVSFQTSQPGAAKVYFRGVASGGDGNHSGSLPSVGIYLDEQPVTTIDGALDVHIYDVERIESLAGPQGTLYGASSEAGTLRIITNKPDTGGTYGRFDGEVNKVDGGGIGSTLEGMFNTPLGNRAAVRVVGWYQKDAGYIDNVPGSRTFLGAPIEDGEGNVTGYAPGITVDNDEFVEDDYNTSEVIGGRAALKIDLTENWTVTGTVIGQDMKSNGTFAYDPSVGDLEVQRFFPESFHDRFVQAAVTLQGKIGNFDITYAGATMERKINSQTDYTDYAEAYDALYADYGGVANYQYFTNEAGDTIDPRQTIVGKDRFTKQSHELRIASPTTDRLRFVAGVFYQRQGHNILQDYQVPNLSAAMSVNGWEGTLWLTKQNRIDRDAAIFGEISFDITPTLTLTAGGRSFTYDNSLIGFFGFGRSEGFLAGTDAPNAVYGSSGVRRCFTTATFGLDNPKDPPGTLLPAAIDGTPCTNLGVQTADGKILPKHAEGSGFSPKLNLSWKASPDLMLYTTWSKGFRPGGINRRASVPNYDPDYLTNMEFGWKASFDNRKLFINGAIYTQEWESFQYAFLGQNSFTEIHNGPDADIKGLEVDVTWAPGNGFTFGGSAAFTDAKTTSNLCAYEGDTEADCSGVVTSHETQFDDAGNPVDVYTDNDDYIAAPIGTRLPVTPQVKLSANARYAWEMGDHHPYVQIDAAYQSGASNDIRVEEAGLMGDLKGFSTVNLALGGEFGGWSVEAYLRNAFDERGQQAKFVLCSVCYQRSYIVPTTPRSFGIRLGSKF